MKVNNITINNYELSYLDQGAGEPLILVHGSLSDYRSWEKQIGEFSKRYRTIAISLRHCFPEIWDGSNGSFSIRQHVADLLEFIKKLSLPKAHILGHSRGGAVVLKLICEHTDLFRSAILVDPAPFIKLFGSDPSMLGEMEKRNQFVHESIKLLHNGDIDKGLELFTDSVSLAGTWRKLPESAKKIRRANAWSLKSLEADAKESIEIENLKKLSLHILLLSGQMSPVIYKKMHEKLEEYLPNARKRIVMDASHGMHRDNPESFNNSVLKFLNNFIRLDNS